MRDEAEGGGGSAKGLVPADELTGLVMGGNSGSRGWGSKKGFDTM